MAAQLQSSIQDFLESLASGTPTPGGGSVAALSGALAASLILMVSNLTLDKKKSASNEQKLKQVNVEAMRLQRELADAVDQDSEAYRSVIACYRLPKETEVEKDKRTEALQRALVQAAEVPYAVASACARLLELCPLLVKIGTPNAISDIAVATHLAEAAVQSALYNVEINCNQITDVEFVRGRREASETLSRQATASKEETLNVVQTVLGQ